MPSLSETLYRKLSGDENGAEAEGISEEAAEAVAPNFFIQLIATVATKTGDQLMSPRLVLTWLLASISAPAAAISLLVPVREAFALLPQIFVGALIQRSPIRKWYWIGGSLCQGLCVFLILGTALWLDSPALAGWSILGLLALFSCARVFNSISGKDLRGKTLPKRRRGMAGGTASAVAGATTLLVALYFIALDRDQADIDTLAWILVLAGLLWWIGAAVFFRLREFPSEIETTGEASIGNALETLSLVRTNRAFRNFILTRSGLVGNALVLPLVVLLVFRQSEGSGLALGAMMAVSGLAAMCSAYVWGKLADRSSRLLLLTVGLGGALFALAAVAIDRWLPASPLETILLGVVFFLLAVIHQGTRIGRKTYLIDLAKSGNRSTMVSVSNTLIGIALLAIGAVVGFASEAGSTWAILVCAIFSLVGGLSAIRLPEVENH